MTNTALVMLPNGELMYCEQAIGGEYFHTIAKLCHGSDEFKRLDPCSQMVGRLIISYGSAWYVTSIKPGANNVLSAVVRCKSLAAAKKMQNV